MLHESATVREILRYAEAFRGAGICLAPSGIGMVGHDDVEVLLQDVALIAGLGIDLTLIDYEGRATWKGVSAPKGVPHLFVKDGAALVSEAVKRKAKKICLVAGTDRVVGVGGVLDDVPLSQAKELLNDARITAECREVLKLAVSACEKGIPRVHVFNAHRHGALLEELFTNSGAGTMFYAGSPHKEVRRMVPSDRFGVCELLHPSIPKKTMGFVRDSEADLRVFTVDGVVHGISRVSLFHDTLVVKALYHSARFNVPDVLEHLLRGVLDEARERNVRDVAVLVTEIPALMRIQPWFTKLGFTKGRTTAGESTSADAWLKKIA